MWTIFSISHWQWEWYLLCNILLLLFRPFIKNHSPILANCEYWTRLAKWDKDWLMNACIKFSSHHFIRITNSSYRIDTNWHQIDDSESLYQKSYPIPDWCTFVPNLQKCGKTVVTIHAIEIEISCSSGYFFRSFDIIALIYNIFVLPIVKSTCITYQ